MKHKIAGVIFLILIAAGIVAGIYYWDKKQKSNDFAQRFYEIEGKQVVTPNPVQDWKTYTNSDYGFQISYPANLQVDSVPSEGPIYISSAAFELSPVRLAEIAVNTINPNVKKSREFYLTQNPQAKSLNIAGLKAVQFKHPITPNLLITKIFSDSNEYEVTYIDESNEMPFLELYSQMVATFKVTK